MEVLPNEIVENIVAFLGLDDIRSLRQTSQTLASKATQEHFKSFYRVKHVELTRRALDALVEATKPGQLGSLVEELVLSGVVANTRLVDDLLHREECCNKPSHDALADHPKGRSDTQVNGSSHHDLERLGAAVNDLHQSGRDIELLSKAFRNIRFNGRNARLKKLTLRVNAYLDNTGRCLLPAEENDWRLVWKCAANTWNLTLRSLSASALPLDKLDLFNQEQLNRCSLACNELSNGLSSHDVTTSFRSLKSISVSLSDRDIGWQGQMDRNNYRMVYQAPKGQLEVDRAQSFAKEEVNFDGLEKLVQLTDALEELDIHYFHLRRPDPASIEYAREDLFSRMARLPKLPKLHRCKLRGLHVMEVDLLHFVKFTAPRDLALDNVTISSGSFRSLFEYCSTEDAHIENLLLDELRDSTCPVRTRPLHFGSPQNPANLVWTFSRDNWRLTRVGSENRSPVQYYVPHSASSCIDYNSRQEWLGQQRLVYGPP